jgi:hypothetical protein
MDGSVLICLLVIGGTLIGAKANRESSQLQSSSNTSWKHIRLNSETFGNPQVVAESRLVRRDGFRLERGSIDNTTYEDKPNFPFEARGITGSGLHYNIHGRARDGLLNHRIMGEQRMANVLSSMGVCSTPFVLTGPCGGVRKICIQGNHIFPGQNIQRNTRANILQSVFYRHQRYILSARPAANIKRERTNNPMFYFDPWSLPQYKLVGCSLGNTAGGMSLNNSLLGYRLRSISLILHSVGEIFRSVREVMGINASSFHFSQLAAHGVPLKYADDHGAKTKKSDGERKADHPPFGTFNTVVDILYIATHFLIGCALCFLAVWTIWKRFRLDNFRWQFLLCGLLLYALAGGFIWHGFIVTQKVLDMP